MRTKGSVALVVSLAFAAVWPQWSLATPVTVDYQATDLGAGRWSYTYTVTNNSLTEPVREFTIWFDKEGCTNLEVVSADPPAGGWSELVSQPDPVLGDAGFYDALSLGTGIAAGATVGGFSVAFNWQRTDVPGPQAFDVVNPTTFATLSSGVTTPEPGSILLLVAAAGGLTMPFRPRRQKWRPMNHEPPASPRPTPQSDRSHRIQKPEGAAMLPRRFRRRVRMRREPPATGRGE